MGKNIMAYKGIKKVFALLSMLTVIQSVAIIFQTRWLAHIIASLFHGELLQKQTKGILCFLFVFLLRHLGQLLIKKITCSFGQKTVKELRMRLMESIFDLGPCFSKTEGTGNLVSLIIDGHKQLRLYLELFIPKLTSVGIIPWVILIFIFYQDTMSGVILCVTMPILILFMILLGLAAKKKTDTQWNAHHVLSNHFVDSLRGLETLKFLGKSRKHVRIVERVSDRYRNATMGTLRIAFLSTFALDFFTMLSVAIVAVTLGIRLINGHITLEPALMILLLAPEYFLPIRELGNDYHATLDGKKAGDEMLDILKKSQQSNRTMESIERWNRSSLLQLQGVKVQHEEDGPISIQNINFDIEGMKKIGIVGESGAGKTTLINLLGGFIKPIEGSIQLNGQNIDLTSHEWQTQITYIPQHPFIFNETVADNIRFYQQNATNENVELAISQVGLQQVIEKMPNKHLEMIGDGGRQLSGGQAQRIGLARAFLSDRPIILLDEPTAQVDIETEYELKQLILQLFNDKLFILATHRLHWMKDMDMIIVIQDGNIVEKGTHSELMQKKCVYYQLIQAQLENI